MNSLYRERIENLAYNSKIYAYSNPYDFAILAESTESSSILRINETHMHLYFALFQLASDDKISKVDHKAALFSSIIFLARKNALNYFPIL